MKRVVLLSPVLVLLVACGGASKAAAPQTTPAAVATSATPASTFDLNTNVTIKGPYSTGVDAMTVGAPCIGISNAGKDYETIASGAALVVKDGSGDTVGVGTLDTGRMTVVDLATRQCVFPLDVTGITAGRGFYQLFIGGGATQQMKEADFRANPAFTLGGA